MPKDPHPFDALVDNIIILPDEKERERVTRGGIIMPETAAGPKTMKGTVVKVGPGKLTELGGRQKPGVAVGARVFYQEYAGLMMEVDGVEYRVVKEELILCELHPTT